MRNFVWFEFIASSRSYFLWLLFSILLEATVVTVSKSISAAELKDGTIKTQFGHTGTLPTNIFKIETVQLRTQDLRSRPTKSSAQSQL